MLPIGNYEINSSKTYCTKPSGNTEVNDSNVKVIYSNNLLNFNGIDTKNTKCYVYLDKKQIPMTMNEILSKYTKNTSRSGIINVGFTGNTPTTVYSKEDDSGTSYVFAGVNPNNWVKIGKWYFRIIRFNGDGTMRLIYSGEGSAETSGSKTGIGRSSYNSHDTDNAYIGYMYGSVGANSYANTHANTNNSSIKEVLDIWYANNLSNYSEIIDGSAGFCNERGISNSSWSGYGKLGYGINATIYKATDRFLDNGWNWLKSINPSLKCSQINDLFTIIGSVKGNKKLEKPIGLITVDEYMLAGGGINETGYSNTDFWLFTDTSYWTMTPNGVASKGSTFGFIVTYYGYIDYQFVVSNAHVRSEIGNCKQSDLRV